MFKKYLPHALSVFLIGVVLIFGAYLRGPGLDKVDLLGSLGVPSIMGGPGPHKGEHELLSTSTLEDFLSSFKARVADEYLGITIVAFGDVMLDRAVRTYMDENGLNYPFEKMQLRKLEETKNAHIIMANLEGPITTYQVPTSKSISFRFKPDVVNVLKYAGFDVLTLANNHALDQGWNGRDETIKYLTEGDLSFFGNPRDDIEDHVYFTEINDQTFSFIGFDDTIFKLNDEKVANLIKTVDEKSDITIVSIHWGAEYEHRPLKRMVSLAHLFVDSGADIVIGHHPHVVQVMEVYKNAPIFYSLGNFVFDQYWSLDTQEGMGVNITIRKKAISISLLPFAIPKSQPTLMQGDEKRLFLEKFLEWHNGFSETGWLTEEMKSSIRNGELVINL
jgi:poly-gamma-glutamate synthesis protein (capsule biosynthesis protein)